jgi:hypothetical protein
MAQNRAGHDFNQRIMPGARLSRIRGMIFVEDFRKPHKQSALEEKMEWSSFSASFQNWLNGAGFAFLHFSS